MPRCDVCKENKRGSQITQLHHTGQIICDNCLRVGEEKLDLQDPSEIDEETMQKALRTTKEQREDGN